MIKLNEVWIGISVNNDKTFLAEVEGLFKDMGFETKRHGRSYLIERTKGDNKLYASVLYIMGILKDAEVDKVRSAVSTAKSFCDKGYTTIDQVLSLSRKEEMEYYHSNYDGRIDGLLKRHFNTRNRKYYVDKYDVIFALADEIMVRTAYSIFGTSLDDPVMIYIEKNIDRMLREGKLEQGVNKNNIRTKVHGIK